MNYTRRELMVAAAAREISDGDKVFVGMRLPLLGFAVAKETHAPNAVGIFESGIIRDWPALESIFTMSDPPNVARSLYCGGLNDVMTLLPSGNIGIGTMTPQARFDVAGGAVRVGGQEVINSNGQVLYA